jgi:opacity protein-like surface antigen
MRIPTLALALPLLLAAPAHAADSVNGNTCRLVADPAETRLDVAAYHVVGGPLVVGNAAVTSVTVTCQLLQDDRPTARITETHAGNVGYAKGHVTVATLLGPSIGVCTQVTWTGGAGGSYDDCGA